MKKSIPIKKIFSFYFNAARKYPVLLLGGVLTVPLTVLINNSLPPLVAAGVFDRISRHDYIPHDVMGSFGTEIFLYGGLVIFGGLFGWRLVDLFVWKLEANVTRDIANKTFNHLLHQSASFHADTFAGSMVSQNNKLIGAYVRVADTTFFQTLPMIFAIVFAVGILIGRAPGYALMLLGFSIFYISTAFWVTGRARKMGAIHAASESHQTGMLADAVTNVMAIKSYARYQHESKRFAKSVNDTRSNLLKLMSVVQRQQMYFGGITSVISSSALIMGIVTVVLFGANIATVFLMVTYTAAVVRELFSFSNSALRNYNRALGDASDMVEILNQKPSIVDVTNPQELGVRRGRISFEDVEFTHGNAKKAIFKHLNLVIKPGEKVGLVGHSGSGKTTLTRLLLRFSDIQKGSIKIDGKDIAKLRQNDLHNIIAYVPQEPLLFHRSIAENINYGDLSANRQSIEAVAKLAHASEFIDELPNGYETLVGERGVKLSGGQRQRIAIARAMIKNAPILILDEATSALDSESETLIQDALWKLMEGRTAIVIAHRLSTVQKMDRIVVMDDGKIIEQGSHKELLAQKGAYASLWAHQSGGFIED